MLITASFCGIFHTQEFSEIKKNHRNMEKDLRKAQSKRGMNMRMQVEEEVKMR